MPETILTILVFIRADEGPIEIGKYPTNYPNLTKAKAFSIFVSESCYPLVVEIWQGEHCQGQFLKGLPVTLPLNKIYRSKPAKEAKWTRNQNSN